MKKLLLAAVILTSMVGCGSSSEQGELEAPTPIYHWELVSVSSPEFGYTFSEYNLVDANNTLFIDYNFIPELVEEFEEGNYKSEYISGSSVNNGKEIYTKGIVDEDGHMDIEIKLSMYPSLSQTGWSTIISHTFSLDWTATSMYYMKDGKGFYVGIRMDGTDKLNCYGYSHEPTQKCTYNDNSITINTPDVVVLSVDELDSSKRNDQIYVEAYLQDIRGYGLY